MARWSYVAVAGIFTVCVVIQTFLAGMAVFVDPANWWSLRTMFVMYLQLLPIGLLVLALLGRLPRDLKWLPVGLLVLVIGQHVTVGLFAASVVAALNPVNELMIFGLAVISVQRARPWLATRW